LNEKAKTLCPFMLNEIITLENGKQGKVTEIKYLSLDYDFYKENGLEEFASKIDEIEYQYAYSLDNKSFTITWNISGFRLNKKGEVSKVKFSNISPMNYIIDKNEKTVIRKQLPDFMNIDNIALFEYL